ncbi:MAG: Ig-like domain-containing protein, partial [Gemmatimonadales bacterium]
IHGAPLRHTWAKIIEDAAAGTTAVKVRENVTDWEIGSSVLMTATNLGPALAEYEVRQIASVTWMGDHTRVTLSQPLTYTHKGVAPAAAEVALLSRNVRVATKYAYPTLGHTMYMQNATGTVGYAEFRDLGNFGCLGRYPVHFHMMGESSRGMTVRGASIWRSQNHFLNIHGSAGLLVEDTVGFDAVGLGYVIGEPATGMTSPDSVLIHNLAAKVYEKQGMLPADTRTSGFWIRNRNSVLIDNVASGSSQQYKLDSGFFLQGATAEAEGEFDATKRKLVFVRNEAHSNKSNGWLSWTNGGEFFIVLDFKTWRNGRHGIQWGAYGPKFHIHRAQAFENGAANIFTSVVRTHLQDSLIYGTVNVPTPVGFLIGGYFVPNDPAFPSKWLRNSFLGHQKDVAFDHTPCAAGAGEEFNPLSKACSAAYAMAVGNSFKSMPAIDFGWHANANSWVEVRSWNGVAAPAITATNFRLTRKDQPKPDVDAYYYAPFDAWFNPGIFGVIPSSQSGAMGSAMAMPRDDVTPTPAPTPGSGGGSGGKGKPKPGPTATPGPAPTPAPGPSPAPGAFVPPTIAFLTPKEGDLLSATMTLEVTVSWVNPIARVDFFADEVLLSSVTSAPYRFTWSTAAWARKRAYVFACATDTAGLTACTTVLKLVRTAP